MVSDGATNNTIILVQPTITEHNTPTSVGNSFKTAWHPLPITQLSFFSVLLKIYF
jgi:hypothetical protein